MPLSKWQKYLMSVEKLSASAFDVFKLVIMGRGKSKNMRLAREGPCAEHEGERRRGGFDNICHDHHHHYTSTKHIHAQAHARNHIIGNAKREAGERSRDNKHHHHAGSQLACGEEECLLLASLLLSYTYTQH